MTMSLLVPGPEPAGLLRQAPAPPDAELVARARRGDSIAFELVMRRHNRRLFRIARGLVWNDVEAEDVLQESYVRAFARLGDLVDGQALAAWPPGEDVPPAARAAFPSVERIMAEGIVRPSRAQAHTPGHTQTVATCSMAR